MPLDYSKVMALPPIETRQQWTFRDTILYALGVGVASEVCTDHGELQYVYEAGLKTLPTMVVALAYPGFWLQRPEYGATWPMVLHGEQSIEIHRSPLPVEGGFYGVTTIDEIFDKGAQKGAILLSTRRIYSDVGEHVATTRQSSFLRGDGGFGGRSDGAPKPHALPDREPDYSIKAPTRIDQALLYRLSGDYNPVHADPEIAMQGGFDRPILHGLATYGVVGRALTKSLCDDIPERFRRMDARFASPVFPGETFEIDVWRETPGAASFRARVIERDIVVLNNGYLEFGD